MTEATSADATSEASEFLQLWAENFSQVMGQIAGSAMPWTAAEAADIPAAAEGDLFVVATCSGARRGEMSFRLAAAAVLRLAHIFMSEPATREAPVTQDHREAVIELWRQIAGVVATAAKARWGEIQLRVELAPGTPSWPAAATFFLQTGDPGPEAMVMECGLSAALVAELKAEKSAATGNLAAESSSIPNSSAPTSSASTSLTSTSLTSTSLTSEAPASPPFSSDQGQPPGTLDRLMDVQLSMTLRFGARSMLLREVLELGPGTVVELERKIQDPVELLLDGKLIARGEVVVIEGNYGLRVTDVSPLGAGQPDGLEGMKSTA